VLDIREVGVILNNYTKQINSNITQRKQIDDSFIGAFESVLLKAKNDFLKWRESNYIEFFRNLKIERDGDISKINNKILQPKKWHGVNLSLNDNESFSLKKKTYDLNFSLYKFVNSLIKLFLNQGNFFDKETKELQGFLIKSLSVIKINAFQIFRNKKKNAYENEILIADKIINFTDDILSDLRNDPILHSGRKFDLSRFALTVKKLENCLI
jgi:hypothetical protein